jgi:hypothetical protein
MKNHKILFFLLISLASQAQKSTVDLQTRPAVTLKLDLPKGWEISTQYRAKFDQNSSNYKGTYLYLGLEKKVNKYLSAMVNYRFGLVDGEKFNRISGGLEGKFKYKSFTFSLRELYQSQQQVSSENIAENYLRSRFAVKCALVKKLDFTISTEPFMHKKNGVFETDFWRNRAGITYEYMKNKSVNLFYIWQPDVNKKYPDTKNFIGINFIFDLKVK